MNEAVLNPREEAGDGPELPARMQACVESLLGSAHDLREALTRRRVSTVWDILSRQEQQAALLESYCRLWADLGKAKPGTANDPDAEVREQMRKSVAELRRVQQTNTTLAHGLLAVVRRALAESHGEQGAARHVYTRRGKPGWTTASRFVCRIV